MAARRQKSRRFGTLFVLLGIVAVLGTTFAAGFLAGRHWERVRVVTGLVKPQAGREPARERAGALRPPDPPPGPAMTFYQELTAPLTSPPPRPAKTEPRAVKPDAAPPTKPESARADTPAIADPSRTPAARPEPAAAKAEPAAAKPEPAADAPRGRYTVQVAAYATRAQAETLAAGLRARGFDADVSETTTANGARYRVRVGAYPTKDAANDVAARLSGDARLSGFVTVR